MDDHTTTRHLKRYRIDDREILEYLRRNDNWPDYLVAAANVKGPPAGCHIHTVYFDYSTQGYWVVISHPEFPEVPDGEYIPAAENDLVAERVILFRGDDNVYRIVGGHYPDSHSSPAYETWSTEDVRAMRDRLNEILYDRET